MIKEASDGPFSSFLLPPYANAEKKQPEKKKEKAGRVTFGKRKSRERWKCDEGRLNSQ